MEIRDRDKIEAAFYNRLAKLSSRHRAELTELLGDPPDPGRVPMSFWQRVEREREEEIAAALMLIYILAGDSFWQRRQQQYPSDLIAKQQAEKTDNERRDAWQVQGESWAKAKAKETAEGYVTHSRERLDRKRIEWEERAKADRADQPASPPTKADAREAANDILSKRRDESVAVTATTQARAAGAEIAVKTLQVESADDYWQTEEDGKVCQICAPLNQRRRANWETKFPEGPPAHPGCRCEIIYVAELEPATTT